ncbi:MAG: cyclodeaminase/cyclohydrolase family protein [Oscillospiraceae bacterium]|nr:cyclodeaminase/cyclohydrolase family protein [Oscillospiraceae bacterium]
MVNKSCVEFIDVLASKEPVPGGGGASALVGAIGMALGSMVGNLTLGKKKYADVQEDIKAILVKAKALQSDLIKLVQEDAEVFEPLSKAYGMPKETEEQKAEKDRVMEEALKLACSVPMSIMEKAAECIDLHYELGEKGTRIAISDVGVGVLFVKAALIGASLNVYINTKMMKDRGYADEINAKADRLIAEGSDRADKIFEGVMNGIR